MGKNKSITDELIAGLTEFAEALEAGEELGPVFTCRRMQLNLKPIPYTGEMVKETRKLLGTSQQMFAHFLGVSVKTVSQWEQDQGAPKAIACRFMDEIRQNPEHYRERLRSLIVPKATGKSSV